MNDHEQPTPPSDAMQRFQVDPRARGFRLYEATPWHERRTAPLGHEEIDGYDRLVPGRVKRRPTLFQ